MQQEYEHRKEMLMKITKIPRLRDQRKRRVAAYCRVSTLLENQEDSLENQSTYYTAYIQSHEDWEFAGIYSDERSGREAENREGFQSMISDALEGKVDYILVKSISRFSRNVVDCQRYVTLLQTNGVYVKFEKEGIDTADPSSSMMFSFLSVLAQNESVSISKNVRWGYQKRYERGEYNVGNNRIFGYDSVKGKLVPNKDADVVKEVFRIALTGKNYGEIARQMKDAGYIGSKGVPLTSSGVRYILSNEAYVGDRLLQKKPHLNPMTKKPEKNVDYHSYYLKDDHEPIIDRETWEGVQKIIEKRKKEKENGIKRWSSHNHFLYGKLFCESCGAPMTRRTLRCSSRPENKETYKGWSCKERILGRKGNGCKNRHLKEEEILMEIRRLMGYTEGENSTDFPVERFIEEVEAVYAGEEIRIVKTREGGVDDTIDTVNAAAEM